MKNKDKKFVIAIARGYGSGGKTIGEQLARELHIRCIDRELLSMASETSGINETLFAEADEKVKGLFKIGKGIEEPANVFPPEDKDFVSDENMFRYQAKVLQDLAKKESFVVIGRAADFILKDFPNVVAVNIQASRQACIASTVNRLKLPEKEAERLVRRTDRYRMEYYEFYTGQKWNDPLNYDISLRSDRIGREKCVEVIKAVTEIKLGICLDEE